MINIHVILYFTLNFGVCSCSNEEESVFHELFIVRNISTLVRPVRNKSHSVVVEMHLSYMQLNELNERLQNLKSTVTISQKWTNELLAWAPEQFGGVKEIVVNNSLVWKPDLVLYNSASNNYNGQLDVHKTRIKMYHNGYASWSVPVTISSSCPIHSYYFPFDYQKCSMVFGSWSLTILGLNITVKKEEINMEEFLDTKDFQITSTRIERKAELFSCCDDPFVTVTFSLVVKRNSGFYIQLIIFPAFLLYFFVMIVFVFPKAIGETMSMSMDCFLSLALLTITVSKHTPPDSDEAPLLGRFMQSSLIVITVAYIINGICIALSSHFVSEIPVILKLFLSTKLARILLCDIKFTEDIIAVRQQASKTETNQRLLRTILKKQGRGNFKDWHPTFSSNLLNQKNAFRPSLLKRSFKERYAASNEIFGGRQNFVRPYDRQYRRKRYLKSLESKNVVEEKNKRDVENVSVLALCSLKQQEHELNTTFWKAFATTIDRTILILFASVYLTIFFIFLSRVNDVYIIC